MPTVEQVAGSLVVKVKAVGPQGAADQLQKTEIVNIIDDHTLELTDAGKMIRLSAAVTRTVTIPPNSDVPFEVGTVITFEQALTGRLAIAAGAGVTLNSFSGATNLLGQYAVAGITQVAADVWSLYGNIT